MILKCASQVRKLAKCLFSKVLAGVKHILYRFFQILTFPNAIRLSQLQASFFYVYIASYNEDLWNQYNKL